MNARWPASRSRTSSAPAATGRRSASSAASAASSSRPSGANRPSFRASALSTAGMAWSSFLLFPALAAAGPCGTPTRPSRCGLTALSDWGWGVKLLLVPAVPAGHSLLSAVGAETAASWGPGGGRPDLLSDLQGDRPSALGCYRDRLACRPRGNDTAPPVAGRKLDRLQAAGIAPSSPQRNSEP